MGVRRIVRIGMIEYAKRKAEKRAKKVGFKNKYPTTPDDLTSSTYMGYKKKVRNWRSKLKQFEKSSLNY